MNGIGGIVNRLGNFGGGIIGTERGFLGAKVGGLGGFAFGLKLGDLAVEFCEGLFDDHLGLVIGGCSKLGDFLTERVERVLRVFAAHKGKGGEGEKEDFFHMRKKESAAIGRPALWADNRCQRKIEFMDQSRLNSGCDGKSK